jgi:hypothetical protein
MEPQLSKEELRQMEKSEKQLKIIIEELKLIQANHERAVIQYTKRLRVKDTAEKVIAAVRERNTNSVTGADMARLIKATEEDRLFQNTKSVQKAIDQRKEVLSNLITKVNTLIDEHKLRETTLIRPE